MKSKHHRKSLGVGALGSSESLPARASATAKASGAERAVGPDSGSRALRAQLMQALAQSPNDQELIALLRELDLQDAARSPCSGQPSSRQPARLGP